MKTLLWLVLAVALTALITTTLARRSAPQLSEDPMPVATVQEVMEGIVDPSARAIFESVGTISNAAGTVDRAPSNDEEWEAVGRHAVVLAEVVNLLRVRNRRVERVTGSQPGTESSAALSPAEIERRITSDPAAWDRHLDDFRAVALKAQKAANDRSVDGLYEVGGDMDLVCERCHQAYWYDAPEGVRIRR